MGDGTKENPYTREDVLRLIEENGGKAEGLDLSVKVFEDGIDLSNLKLEKIIFTKTIFPIKFVDNRWSGAHLEDAVLTEANLEGTDLIGAHLEGAILIGAHLEGADLRSANLERTYLMGAHLEGAFLSQTEISPTTRLVDVDWGNYIVREEREGWFRSAADTYRKLKQWYTTAGMYDIAGQFFFREMEAKRKQMKQQTLSLSKMRHWIYGLICGYGERPWRVITWAASVVLGLALIYFLIGSVWEWSALWDSLYFSAVSFTALGYGNWVKEAAGWVKALGAAESFIGVFSMALFLVTFTRKMTR